MPNGHDKNWVRVCAAIDGFRARFGHWPKRIRVMPVSFADLISNVLNPVGFALISNYVELVPEENAGMIAEDSTGAEFNYGEEGFPEKKPDPPTREWFGEAVLRHDPGW
jgi:hypothetical protein